MPDNIIERALVPFNPSSNTVLNKDKYNLFAPVANVNKVGMAGFNPEDFNVSDESIVSFSAKFRANIEKAVTDAAAAELAAQQAAGLAASATLVARQADDTANAAKQTAEAIDGKATEAQQDAAEALEQVGGKYTKPETGIPASDLADGVQSALDKADSAIQADEKGSAGGVVPLDANGHIPEQYMPGSYDEIRYYDNYASFPSTGTADIIYVARDTNLQYRWGGESYVPMGSHLALGETENTAYRGDRGKAAYDARHSHSNKATLDNIPTPVEGDEHKVLTVNEMADGYELAEASGGTEILVDGEPVESFNANAQYYQESVHMYVGGGEDGGTQIDVDDEALKLTHNDSGTSLVVEDGAVKAITNVDEPFMAAEDEDVVTKKYFDDNAPDSPITSVSIFGDW